MHSLRLAAALVGGVGAFTRPGARLTSADIALDDHPHAERFAGRIETASVDSVLSWLERSGRGAAAFTVR